MTCWPSKCSDLPALPVCVAYTSWAASGRGGVWSLSIWMPWQHRYAAAFTKFRTHGEKTEMRLRLTNLDLNQVTSTHGKSQTLRKLSNNSYNGILMKPNELCSGPSYLPKSWPPMAQSVRHHHLRFAMFFLTPHLMKMTAAAKLSGKCSCWWWSEAEFRQTPLANLASGLQSCDCQATSHQRCLFIAFTHRGAMGFVKSNDLRALRGDQLQPGSRPFGGAFWRQSLLRNLSKSRGG